MHKLFQSIFVVQFRSKIIWPPVIGPFLCAKRPWPLILTGCGSTSWSRLVFWYICSDETKREKEFYRLRDLPYPKDIPPPGSEMESEKTAAEAATDCDYHRMDEQVFWKNQDDHCGNAYFKDIPAHRAEIRYGFDIFRISSKRVYISCGEVHEILTVTFLCN